MASYLRTNDLWKSSIGTFILKFSGRGLMFATHVIVARFIGPEEYGKYIYVFTWMGSWLF